ncbi:BspA family leucine-rich repeat surface protein, partial [Vagococcus sp. BWB3-3]
PNSLANLDVSNFNTSNVTNMSSMFEGLTKVTSLEITNFDTSSVTTMASMFKGANSLANLDVSNFNTSNVTNMSSMFEGLTKVTSLEITNFDTSLVTTMASMFRNASALENIDVSNFNTSSVTNVVAMFENLKKVSLLDVSRFDLQNVTSLERMFSYCETLTELDVSNWDVSKVRSLTSTFQGMVSLLKLDVSRWNTENFGTLYDTFASAEKLNELDVSNWNTSRMGGLYRAFYGTPALKVLDVSNWDTSNFFTLFLAFASNGATVLDVSNWDTKNVVSMFGTFNGNGATHYDFSNWNTENVTEMESMFSGTRATNLDLSTFNTEKVEFMSYMFNQATNLESLDISGFSFESVSRSRVNAMFANTHKLSHLTLGTKFSEFPGDNDRAYLPLINTSTKEYTGRWIGISSNNKDITYASSDSLIDDFEAEHEGTFVWERLQPPSLNVEISVNENDIRIGDVFEVTYSISNRTEEITAMDAQIKIPLPPTDNVEIDESSIQMHYPDGRVEAIPATSIINNTIEYSVGDINYDENIKIVYSAKAIEQINNPVGLEFDVMFKDEWSNEYSVTTQAPLVITGGVLSFKEVPDELRFETTEISAFNKRIKREVDDWTMTVSDTRTIVEGLNKESDVRNDWYVTATTSSPLSNGNKKLVDSLIFKSSSDQVTPLGLDAVPVYNHSVLGEKGAVTTPIVWEADRGILVDVIPGQAAKDTVYKTSIDWNLISAPI